MVFVVLVLTIFHVRLGRSDGRAYFFVYVFVLTIFFMFDAVGLTAARSSLCLLSISILSAKSSTPVLDENRLSIPEISSSVSAASSKPLSSKLEISLA